MTNPGGCSVSPTAENPPTTLNVSQHTTLTTHSDRPLDIVTAGAYGNLEWNTGVAETSILDAQISTRPRQGQRMMARQLTGVKPSPAQDLKFINISHPNDLNRQHEIRTEIRRHVMKDIGQRRRRPRPKEAS